MTITEYTHEGDVVAALGESAVILYPDGAAPIFLPLEEVLSASSGIAVHEDGTLLPMCLIHKVGGQGYGFSLDDHDQAGELARRVCGQDA